MNTDLLAELDPAPALDPTDAAIRRRDAMLERILAADRTAPAPSRRRWRGPVVRRVAIGAAVVALVAPAVVAGVHLVDRRLDPTANGLSSADLAGWTSTAIPQTADQLSNGAKQWCIAATDAQAGASAPVRIFGGDERGDVASMVIARGDSIDVCLADRAGGGGYWELVSSPQMPLPVVGEGTVLLQSDGSHGSDDVGTAWGQAGADIRTVTLRLQGRDVESTVVDGVWDAWWPDATDAGVPTSAIVTYADGRTATVPVRTR